MSGCYKHIDNDDRKIYYHMGSSGYAEYQKVVEEYAEYFNGFEKVFLYGTSTRAGLRPKLNDKIRIL